MADTERKTKKKTKNTKRRKKIRVTHPFRTFVCAYAAILLVMIAVLYFIPWLSDNFAEVMTVEYGQLNQSKEAEVYFVKDETVYYANTDGRVCYHFNEGDNVRRGQTLFEIDSSVNVVDDYDYTMYDERVSGIYGGNNLIGFSEEKERKSVIDSLKTMLDEEEAQIPLIKINLAINEIKSLRKGGGNNKGISIENYETGVSDGFIADTSGVVSYELDGYESELNPYTLSLLIKKKLDEMPLDSFNVFNGAATKGKPVCKVVNDREWYGVTWIDSSGLRKYKEGGKVTLTMDDESKIKGTVEKIYERDGELIVVMKFVSYYEKIATLRKTKTQITTSDEKGLIVKNSFIKEKDGVSGVYVISVSGKIKFTPINVKTTDGEYSLVSSGSFTNEDGELINTVEVYDQIKKVS